MDADAGDADEAGAPAAKWVRKPAEARRAEIVAKAREVFAAQGFTDSGLAEVAGAAQVSKSLLYHYFPGGRPQLFVSVIEELLEELLGELRHAAKVPFSAKTRITHLLSAIFRFFDQNPDAYRLLFQDPTVSHDPAVEAAALTIRAQIAGELASLLAESSMSADDVVSASAGILGFTLSNVELCIAGRIEPEHAWQVTCRFCTSSL
jgi:AcrR family transcriptional regulator